MPIPNGGPDVGASPDLTGRHDVEHRELSDRSRIVKGHTTHAIERDPVDALLQVAGDVGAGMIVVGSKGMHGAGRLTLGNVPNQVSHKARCNVLIVDTESR